MAAPLPFLVLSVCMLGLIPVEATSDTMSSLDSSFCLGGLEVIYPELDIDKCLIIPKKLREKVSTVWGAPQIYFSGAQTANVYVVVMVDPDAPSRTRPTSASWRHWLVVDVQGSSLNRGLIQGTTLTDYHPPTPPHASGLHRYQFMLFKQPPDVRVSLAEQEKSSRGELLMRLVSEDAAALMPAGSRQVVLAPTHTCTSVSDHVFLIQAVPLKNGLLKVGSLYLDAQSRTFAGGVPVCLLRSGKWDLQAFVAKFGLGEPVATLQFLTQNYRD